MNFWILKFEKLISYVIISFIYVFFLEVTEIKGVANEHELEKLVSSNVGDFSSSWLGVVFLNVDPKVEKPTYFPYKLRDTHSWNTKALFYESDSPEPYQKGIFFMCELPMFNLMVQMNSLL